MWFEKQRRAWDPMPDGEMIRRLTLPSGRIDMVLDTDTYNEVDDQFALAYALLSPERLNVQAVYAAPFFNDRSTGPADGMRRSYDEIVRLLGLIGHPHEDFVFRGSEAFLTDDRTPVDSPAARDLVRRAMARPEDDPLYVVCIAAVTDLASALLLEPRLTRHIVVVWLGGQPGSWPDTLEFNLSQDVLASGIVLDSGVPLIRIPCMGVASHLLSTVPELKACIGGRSPLCDALLELFSSYERDHYAWAKEIWDVSTIAYLIDPEWVPTKLVHAPLVTPDSHWAHDERRHLCREAYFCARNPVFRDLFRKLAAHGQPDAAGR